jgi:hypothetical protein
MTTVLDGDEVASAWDVSDDTRVVALLRGVTVSPRRKMMTPQEARDYAEALLGAARVVEIMRRTAREQMALDPSWAETNGISSGEIASWG